MGILYDDISQASSTQFGFPIFILMGSHQMPRLLRAAHGAALTQDMPL